MLNSAEQENFHATNLKLLTMSNSSLLNIAEHENFSANKYENANYCWHFRIYIISWEIFVPSWVEHEKSLITSGSDFSCFCCFHRSEHYKEVVCYCWLQWEVPQWRLSTCRCHSNGRRTVLEHCRLVESKRHNDIQCNICWQFVALK